MLIIRIELGIASYMVTRSSYCNSKTCTKPIATYCFFMASYMLAVVLIIRLASGIGAHSLLRSYVAIA